MILMKKELKKNQTSICLACKNTDILPKSYSFQWCLVSSFQAGKTLK